MDTQPIAVPVVVVAAAAAAAATPSSTFGRSSSGSSTASTVFGSLKWWPSGNSNSRQAAAAAKETAKDAARASGSTVVSACHSLPSSPSAGASLSHSGISFKSFHFGSASQIGQQQQPQQQQQQLHLQHRQKLRESKWFTVDESRVLCAVVEPGFVVEIREGQENESSWGVVQFKASKDRKPKPQEVEIYTIKATSPTSASGRLQRVVRRSLADLWLRGCTVRIQNFGDREHQAHSEKDIRNQVAFALKAKQMMWQSSQHFAFWCRYGERQQDIRRKQVDAIRYKYPLAMVH